MNERDFDVCMVILLFGFVGMNVFYVIWWVSFLTSLILLKYLSLKRLKTCELESGNLGRMRKYPNCIKQVCLLPDVGQ